MGTVESCSAKFLGQEILKRAKNDFFPQKLPAIKALQLETDREYGIQLVTYSIVINSIAYLQFFVNIVRHGFLDIYAE